MGFFSKLASKVLGPTLEKGCVDQYMEFLKSKEFYNTKVLRCADVNYSSDVIRDFAAKYPIQVDSEFHEYLDIKSITFEGQLYRIFYFMHYARAVNVSIDVETEEKDTNKLFYFLNEINKKDLLDQIGFIEKEGKIFIRIFRQLLNTPHIGDGDTFAEGLRDLKQFAETIAKLNYPDDKDWMKWANPKARKPIATAADFWFNQGEDSCLKNFSKTSTLIEKNAFTEVHKMINISYFANVDMIDSFLQYGRINVYKGFPYLTVMEVPIKDGDTLMHSIEENKAIEFCKSWNSSLNFAPCKVVFFKCDDGKIGLNMVMSGMYADDTNTRTYIDFLCSLQKATGIMVNSVR